LTLIILLYNIDNRNLYAIINYKKRKIRFPSDNNCYYKKFFAIWELFRNFFFNN